MMRYNTTIISKALDYSKGDASINKGYIPIQGVYTGEVTEQGGNPAMNIDTFKLDYVEKLLVLAKSKNVPIVVVASPKYGKTSSRELQPIINICRKNNIEFWDYYADSEFMQHKEWFKEPMHLNSNGASVFSKRIVARIEENINI